MAFFGIGKTKNLLESIEQRSWKNEKERNELLSDLKASKPSPEDMVSLLFHSDPPIRQLATEVVLESPSRNIVKLISEQLMEQPSHKRTFGTRIISILPPDLLEPVAESLLKDKNPARKRIAWDIAISVGGIPGDKFMIRALEEAPIATRITALQRLLKNRSPDSLASHLIKIARDPDPRLAGLALEAVSNSTRPEVIDLMVDLFAHGEPATQELASHHIRKAAKQNPEGMQKRLLELLGEGEDSIRRLSVDILFETASEQEVVRQILIFSQNLVGWLRDRILDTLRLMGDRILEPALALLQHEDEDVRSSALVLAETFGDHRIVEPVCKLLKDPDWWLRITACDTLGRIGDTRAVPFLLNALSDDDTRWAAVDALAKIKSPDAIKHLVALLKDERQEVRLEVVGALGVFVDKRLIPIFNTLKKKDPSSEVRTRSAEIERDLSKKLGITNPENDELETVVVDISQLKRPLDKLLATIREKGASDLHITVGESPFQRNKGILDRLDSVPPLEATHTKKAIMSILDERQREALIKIGELDFCHAITEIGRYRVNAFVQRLGLCAACRVIPNIPPTFSDLRLPMQLSELLDYHQGIIVVSGPAASGKSTTLAAIINLINETKPVHIITLEDPIEFVHPPKTALVNQREVGRHTETFARALRAALRQDPDVIMVGEMRDIETIRMALMAAETGHLVIATLHTTSAVQTIDRLVGSFPPEEQSQIRMTLSDSLKYVVSQSLLPRKDKQGRVAVFELLKNTLSISNIIREGKTYQLPNLMQLGRSVGMQTLDQALMDLVEADLIDAETAWGRAEKAETFEPLCSRAFLRQVESAR